MSRILWALFLPLFLIGCSTCGPVEDTPISPEPSHHRESKDYTKLSDDDLCELSFKKEDEDIVEEIYVRNLYCDHVTLECKKQGFNKDSLAMIECASREKMKDQSPDVKDCFASGIGQNDVDGMTNCLVEKEKAHKSQQNSGFPL